MSNIEQMQDNLSYMKDFDKLTNEERSVILEAQKAFNEVKSIPCTGCGYCLEGCPQQIKIPEIFAARNEQIEYGRIEEGIKKYAGIIKENAKACECIGCGQCENACPQHIEIIEELKKCSEVFDK
jgi:predicted aldo/keto reductase-like oxidoreductase